MDDPEPLAPPHAGAGHAPGASEHDWNRNGAPRPARAVQAVDETLRDGLQGGVPRLPSLDQRAELLASAEALGVREAAVGFPADAEAFRESLGIARRARRRGATLRLGLLGRAKARDLEAIARVRDASGASVAAWVFLGGSRIRRAAERWSRARLIELAHRAVVRAHELGLPVNFGLEDASRTAPPDLDELLRIVVAGGVERVTVCDTVGWLTPRGARRLVAHVRARLDALDARTGLDFHGHSDRGLALATSLSAARAGADRVHATTLGIGERAGNAPLELLLANLALEGAWDGDLRDVSAHCRRVSDRCGLEIPAKHPLFGRDAFATEAGVHAAAIVKAATRRDHDTAARVYAAVDPERLGRSAAIRVGPASGRANVRYALERAGILVSDDEARGILRRVRVARRALSVDELCRLALRELRPSPPPHGPDRSDEEAGDGRVAYPRGHGAG